MGFWNRLFGGARENTNKKANSRTSLDNSQAILQAAHRQLSVNESVAIQLIQNRLSRMIRDSHTGWYKEESNMRGLGTIYYDFQLCERVDFQVTHASNIFYVRVLGFIIRRDQQTGPSQCRAYPIVVSSMHQGFNIIDSIFYKKPHHRDHRVTLHVIQHNMNVRKMYNQLIASKKLNGQLDIRYNCNVLNLHHCGFNGNLWEELDRISHGWTVVILPD